jgi:hypothetical protein
VFIILLFSLVLNIKRFYFIKSKKLIKVIVIKAIIAFLFLFTLSIKGYNNKVKLSNKDIFNIIYI